MTLTENKPKKLCNLSLVDTEIQASLSLPNREIKENLSLLIEKNKSEIQTLKNKLDDLKRDLEQGRSKNA